MGKAELVLEEYEEAEAATGMAPVIRAVELGEFSKEELDRFHHALSLKADGHKGPITAEFIQELQDIIKNSL